MDYYLHRGDGEHRERGRGHAHEQALQQRRDEHGEGAGGEHPPSRAEPREGARQVVVVEAAAGALLLAGVGELCENERRSEGWVETEECMKACTMRRITAKPINRPIDQSTNR